MTVHSQSVTQAGSNSYAYDQNGNMISRTVGEEVWTYSYNAENQLVTIKKNNQLISEYGFDGDGNRVWAKDYEGYLATNPKVTTYIGNYYEVQVEGYVQPTGDTPTQPCSQPYCAYFPYVSNTVTENISYYYADGQRIAMKNNGVVSYLYGDQLGSVSAVADDSGALVSKTFYHPWGTTRYTQSTNPTDYAYTGQMQEGDIYFYNTRWYDPSLGRFLQADTIVPTQQGTQALDRYAYLNNNPVNGTDPTGHCIDGISTAFCVVAGAMVIGAIGGYVAQVAQNMSAGMSFGDALVTDISTTPILQGAAIAGIGVTAAITGSAALGIGAGTIATVGQGICADGDCTNEIRTLTESGQKLIDTVRHYSIPLRGQFHHILSTKVWKVMDDTLKAAFGNNRNSLVVRAIDYAAHHGYQAWHRVVDNKLVDYILTESPTKSQMINKLVELYTPLVERFPTVLDVLNRIK